MSFTTRSMPDPTYHHHDNVEEEEEEERHVEDSLPSSPIVETLSPSASPPLPPLGACALEQDASPADIKSQAVTADDDDDDGDTKARQEADEADERQCRICFAGSEEEDTSGRLISPCLCTGSMRYVHVECINAWRGTGTNAKAFMECPQCHHQYHLRRTLVSGLATSRPILILSTALLFSGMTLTLGQLLHLLLRYSPSALRSIRRPSFSTLGMGMYDLFDPDLGAAFNDGPVIVVGGGGGPMYSLATASISTVFDLMERYSDSGDRLAQALPSPLAKLFFALGLRFSLGLALLGSMSFMSLLISLSLFGPLQLVNGLRGMGFLGNWGRRRGRDGGSSIGTIMIVAFVLIGAINTLFQVYSGVQTLTQKLLRYVETQILEVNPDERRKAEERYRARNTWIRRWIREKRWKSRSGWREVWFRLRLTYEGLRNSWRGQGQ